MTPDFILGQLRLALIGFLSFAVGKGWLTSQDSSTITQIATALGPILIPLAWSWYANWQQKYVPKDSVAIQHIDGTKPDLKPGDSINAVTKVVGALLFALMLPFFIGDARAQVKLTGNIARDFAPTPAAQPLPDLLKAIDAKVLPDLEYAIKLADASGNQLTGDCFKAWRDLITARNTAIGDTAEPSPHIITDFEKAVEIRNALQPTSPFMVKCAPVASMIKLDVAKFMGLVISGGAGLATLVPGL